MPNYTAGIQSDPTNPNIEVQDPAGTSFAGFKFTPSDASVAPQVVTAAPWSAVFAFNPGPVYCTMQAIDQNGKMLGPVFTSNTRNVEADISVSIPNVISVSLAPQ